MTRARPVCLVLLLGAAACAADPYAGYQPVPAADLAPMLTGRTLLIGATKDWPWQTMLYLDCAGGGWRDARLVAGSVPRPGDMAMVISWQATEADGLCLWSSPLIGEMPSFIPAHRECLRVLRDAAAPELLAATATDAGRSMTAPAVLSDGNAFPPGRLAQDRSAGAGAVRRADSRLAAALRIRHYWGSKIPEYTEERRVEKFDIADCLVCSNGDIAEPFDLNDIIFRKDLSTETLIFMNQVIYENINCYTSISLFNNIQTRIRKSMSESDDRRDALFVMLRQGRRVHIGLDPVRLKIAKDKKALISAALNAARSCLYSLDMAGRFLKDADAVSRSISVPLQQFKDHFPYLRDIRNSAYHANERVSRITQSTEKIPSAPLENFDIRSGGGLLFISGMLAGSDFVFTAANGAHNALPITWETYLKLRAVTLHALDCFPDHRSSSPGGRGA